ncbi:hypothetical protein IH992_04145 [Candidatus Poribacteria bacterium]|nr:hypothetical protein [Candidatus Poribacteria bacterium]
MSEVIILEQGYNAYNKGVFSMPFLPNSKDITKAVKQGAIAGGGLLANRFISPKISDMLGVTDSNARLAISGAMAIVIGIVGKQFLSSSDATLLTTGALAQVVAEVVDLFVPQAALSGGRQLGLAVVEPLSLQRPVSPPFGLPVVMNQNPHAIL